MIDLHRIIAVIQSLEQSKADAQELIGELGVERSHLITRAEQLLRRSIVAELALRRVIAEVNPHLSMVKQQMEFDRLIGAVEDDRALVQGALEAERLRSDLVGDLGDV